MDWYTELGLHWAFACAKIHPWEIVPEPTYTTTISVMPYLMKQLENLK